MQEYTIRRSPLHGARCTHYCRRTHRLRARL